MKNKFSATLMALLALVAALCVCFVACDQLPDDDTPVEEDIIYTVSFNLDGGSCSANLADGLKVVKGTALNLSSYVITKEHHTFGGWTDGTNTIAADGSITVNGDTTLTALWTLNSYIVTFNVNGGNELANSTVSKDYNTQLSLADYQPTRTNYLFKGWTDGTDSYAADAQITVTQNITLTAVWALDVSDLSKFVFEETETEVTLKGVADGFDLEKVILPAEYNGKPITAIAQRAFSYNKVVKQIYLDGMTNLKEIGNNAFASSPLLQVVSLKGLSNLTTIGDSAFYGTYNGADSLKTVVFDGCTSLESIGQMAFAYQEVLESIDLSSCTKLTSIARQMLDGCSALTTVSLPASLQSIANNADFFRGCDSLQSITVAEGNAYFVSENGVMYTAGKTEIIKFPACSTATQFVAPATVTKVWGSAFQNADKLTNVDLSACTALTNVGFNAFSGCLELTLTVPFTADGRLEDGTKVTLGSGWKNGVDVVNYQQFTFVELTVSGIKDNAIVGVADAQIIASATYGTESVAVVVTLNGTEVACTDGKYNLTYVEGANTVVVTATHGQKTATQSFTVTYKLKPSVSATLTEGKVYYGQYIEFDVIAKDAGGNALGKSAVSVKLNFGSGAYTPFAGLAITDGTGGKVHVQIDMDTLRAWGYYDGGEFTVIVVATDGLSAEVSFKIEHKEGAEPKPTVTTTVVDGKNYYGQYVEFDVTAKDASGKAIGKDGIVIKTNWGYGLNPLTSAAYTMEDVDGNVHVKIDFTYLRDMWYYEGGKFTLEVSLKDDATVKASYSIEHKEGQEPKASVTTTVVDGKNYYGQYVEFDVTAKDASGKAIGKDGIVIKTNWGYGLNPLTSMAYTMENVGDNVHVKIDFDFLWSNFYYEGGKLTLEVSLKDDATVKVSYSIEHTEGAEPNTISTTVEDGKNYYGQYVEFDVTATGADGKAVGKDGIVIKTNWGYGLNPLTSMAYTTQDVSGKVHVKIDFDFLWSNFYYEGGKFTLEISLKDNAAVKVSYQIEHKEGAEPNTITTTVEDGKKYSGQYIEFDITATGADGKAVGKDGITIKTNWGYGLNPLTSMAYTTQDVSGKVHVKIDFDFLWSNFYYEGGKSTLEISLKDNAAIKVSYSTEHVEA